MEKSRKKPGPKVPQIDVEQLKRLAELQCNMTEAAYVLGISRKTIMGSYRDDWEVGVALGKIKLRRAMFRNATEKDNAAVQIFLSKNLLGYSDNGMVGDDDGILPWDDIKNDENNTK